MIILLMNSVMLFCYGNISILLQPTAGYDTMFSTNFIIFYLGLSANIFLLNQTDLWHGKGQINY